ncbi:MAG: alpha/beta hydrolase [Gammaproteobacteria bacterium]
MSNKPVIYLLPGLLCDQSVWQYQREVLNQFADVRIPNYIGVDSLSKIGDLILADAPPKFSVVGHSMGGRVGLELINKAPERIEHLVLISVGAHPVNDEECEQRSSLVEEAASIGMDKYAESWADLMLSYSESQHPEKRQIIADMARRQSLDDFIAHITAGLGRSDQTLYLPHISIPVLLIVGDKDRWSPVSQHKGIRVSLKQPILQVISDAGHMVILDQPEAVNKLLFDWFYVRS